MNVSTRAANQLRALEPDITARILDHLTQVVIPDRASVVEIETPGGTYRCFVARHRAGRPVLLAIVASRQEAS